MSELHNKFLKKWKLNTNFDKYDLAYRYVVNFFNLVKIGKTDFYNEEVVENLFIRDINNWKLNVLLKKLNILKNEYLILCDQDLVNNYEIANCKLNDAQYKIDKHFEFLADMLMMAREKLDYIMEIQFKYFDKFIYSAFLLANVFTIERMLSSIIKNSFKFPNVCFKEQYEASLKPAQRQIAKWKNKKNMKEDLNKIIKKFIFCSKLFFLWKDFILKKMKILKININENICIKIKEVYKLLLRWCCFKFIIPLHIAVDNNIHSENYKQLIKSLYTGENFYEILNIVCKKFEIIISNNDVENIKELNFFINMWKDDDNHIKNKKSTQTNLFN